MLTIRAVDRGSGPEIKSSKRSVLGRCFPAVMHTHTHTRTHQAHKCLSSPGPLGCCDFVACTRRAYVAATSGKEVQIKMDEWKFLGQHPLTFIQGILSELVLRINSASSPITLHGFQQADLVYKHGKNPGSDLQGLCLRIYTFPKSREADNECQKWESGR